MNDQRFEELRSTLAADGYNLQVDQKNGQAKVTISAADGICGDCLVPKPLMLGMLQPILDVDPDSIELLYPNEL